MDIGKILELLGIKNLDESDQNVIKEKLESIIDIKVNEKVQDLVKEEKSNLLTEYEEKFEEYKEEITSKFSNFLDSVLDEELVIPENIVMYAKKGELYDDLIEQFKVRLAIDEDLIDKEAKALLKECKDEILSLRNEVNKLTEENLTLENDSKKLSSSLYLRNKCSGLTETQKDYVIKVLGDEIDVDKINEKFDIVLSSFDLKEKKKDEETFECVCPKCGEISVSEQACSLLECETCNVKLEEKKEETKKKDESLDEPFKQHLQRWTKMLKENRI